jgi:group II intron reverse transcriptase/maturase
MVVKDALEPILEPCFHADSYGYRPNKSAHDALAVARQRCWRADWVLDVDIKGFFDNIDHTLLMKAVRKHTDCKWIMLYIERWLTAPVLLPDGTLQARDKGTPQGGVISPLLANLFLHYTFDTWMTRHFSVIGFERYADDVVIHCKSLQQATLLRERLKERLAACKLEMSPSKTKIVYCKDGGRTGDYPEFSFDFLGYTFRPRKAQNKEGVTFLSFLPAISGRAAKAIRQKVQDWKLHLRPQTSMQEIAGWINPVLRGWLTYYGRFYRSALYPVLAYIDLNLLKWAKHKLNRLRRSLRRATNWLERVRHRQPGLFAHWRFAHVR